MKLVSKPSPTNNIHTLNMCKYTLKPALNSLIHDACQNPQKAYYLKCKHDIVNVEEEGDNC